MNAHQVGSEDWWRVVRSMPYSEAFQHLNDYRAALAEASVVQKKKSADPELARVNSEIKYRNKLQSGVRWYEACRLALPPEMLEAVLVQKELLERAHGIGEQT